jgi:hypothetical protein
MFYYITESVLSLSLPTGFVRSLLRIVTDPGGFPLTYPNSLLLVNRGFLLNSPAHALLDTTTFIYTIIPYLW